MDNFIALIIMAVIPSIILFIITYFIDTKEKEPLGLLAGLFGLGVVSILPALILEIVGELILSWPPMPEAIRSFIDAFFVVAVAEEGSKFLLMWLLSWRNRAFNYRFDGIVYAVYTSLGFATLENIMYVLQNGFGNAVVRGLTSVPLHASCGVLMGIFYGHARGCAYAGNKKGIKKNIILSLLVPILVHGFYDFVLFLGSSLLLIVWLLFTLAIFVIVIVNLVIFSKKDHPIVLPETAVPAFGQPHMWFPSQTGDGRFGRWMCGCGYVNTTNFCPACGMARPMFTQPQMGAVQPGMAPNGAMRAQNVMATATNAAPQPAVFMQNPTMQPQMTQVPPQAMQPQMGQVPPQAMQPQMGQVPPQVMQPQMGQVPPQAAQPQMAQVQSQASPHSALEAYAKLPQD